MITSDRATRPGPTCDPYDAGLPRLTALGISLDPTPDRTLGRSGPAIHAASFTVRAGETVALIGEPGTGKSALLRVTAGLLVPTYGVVSICGSVLATPSGPQGCAVPARLVSTWDLLLASRTGAAPGLHGETCSCPGLLVADEPTTGLPRAHRTRVWRALDTARRAGQAVLVGLRPDDAFDALHDRSYLLTGGRMHPLTPDRDLVPA